MRAHLTGPAPAEPRADPPPPRAVFPAPRAAPQCRPRPHPTPRGNSKHGARDGGRARKLTEQGPAAPLGRGSGGGPPGRRPGLGPRARPAMLQRRAGEVGTSPGAAPRLGQAIGRGSPQGSRRAGRGGCPAPAIRAAERRCSHAPAPGLRPALHPRRPCTSLGPRSPAGRKVTWAGPGGPGARRRRRGDRMGRASSARRGAEARAWGGSRRHGRSPRSPPPWQETREAPRAAAGHTPRDAPGPARPRGRGRWGLQGRCAAASAFSIPAQGRAGEDASQTAANRLSLRVSTAITAGLSIRPAPPSLPDTPGRVGGGRT